MPPLDAHHDAHHDTRCTPGHGQRWGPYVVGRALGYGHTCQVYEAHHRDHGTPFALKLRRTDRTRSGTEARFRRESGVLARLQHPHLLRLHERVADGGWREALVVDLASHGTLRRFLDTHGPVPFGMFDALGTGLILGLGACHRAGLHHGQIRATKVLVTGPVEAPVAKLTGLGQARDAAFDFWDDPREDIHDLGAVLYELVLAGHRDADLPLHLGALDAHPWLPSRHKDAITACLGPLWRRPRSALGLLALWQGHTTVVG